MTAVLSVTISVLLFADRAAEARAAADAWLHLARQQGSEPLVLKVREGGRVVNVHALLATGVNADGHRENLGLQVASAEDGAGWLAWPWSPPMPTAA